MGAKSPAKLCTNDDDGAWSPAAFTSCPNNDDACFFETVLSLSTPILWSSHAASLSAWLGYDVRVVFEIVVVAGGASRRARMPCTPPPPSPLLSFNPAAALSNRDRLLDRHVALTRHPREDELIKEAYTSAPNTTTATNANHSLAVWFWGGADYSPSNLEFEDNFGDMAAVFAVRHALAVRTGVVGQGTARQWPPTDIPGIVVTSAGRATPTPYIAAVGSVIAIGTARPGTKLVWGSGYISPAPKEDVHMDRGPIVWRGVRGPLSRALLLVRHGVHTPAIKDPALLVPGLLPCCGEQPPKTFDIVFALHAVDIAAFKASDVYRNLISTHPTRITVVSNVNSFHAAVTDLWSGKRIVASSLHAVIMAHAYGIPVLPMRVTDKVIGGDWKFQDHYLSLGHWEFSGRVALADLDGLSIESLQARIEGHWQPGLTDIDTGRMLSAFPLPRGLSGR